MTKLLLFLMTLCVPIIISVLFSLPIMWLWNGLMPELFKLPEISFLQAIGLNLLCSFLFKSNYTLQSKK